MTRIDIVAPPSDQGSMGMRRDLATWSCGWVGEWMGGWRVGERREGVSVDILCFGTLSAQVSTIDCPASCPRQNPSTDS